MDSWISSGNTIIRPVNATYNSDGQVNKIDIFYEDSHFNRGQVWLTYDFSYNERGQLASIITYNHGYSLSDNRDKQHDYYYSENGDLILYESYIWFNGKITGYIERQMAKFDSQGKRIREERYIGSFDLQLTAGV